MTEEIFNVFSKNQSDEQVLKMDFVFQIARIAF